jgi:hypothetical protein
VKLALIPKQTTRIESFTMDYYGIPREAEFQAIQDARDAFIGDGEGTEDECVIIESFDGETRYSERHGTDLGGVYLFVGNAEQIARYIDMAFIDYERK